MGIKDLSNLLNGKFKTIPIKGVVERKEYVSSFKGKRIGIDTDNWAYQQLYGAQKRNVQTTDLALFDLDRGETLKLWIEGIVKKILEYIEYGITPVYIFDGISPIEKTGTKEERRERYREMDRQISNIRTEIDSSDLVAIEGDEFAGELYVGPLNVSDEKLQTLKKLYTNRTMIDHDEKDFLKNVLSGIGVPVVQATGDAEQLCSRLCIEGKVSAVISNDSDNYPFGCPMLIKDIGPRTWFPNLCRYDRICTVVYLSDVLDSLQLSYRPFVDLCIASKCDYNERMERVGMAKVYELIKTYGSIDNFPSEYKDKIECLKHVRCREIFYPERSETCLKSGYLNFKTNYNETARDTLASIGLEHLMRDLIEALKDFPEPKDRGFEIQPEDKREVSEIVRASAPKIKVNIRKAKTDQL